VTDLYAPTRDDLAEIVEQVWSAYLDPEGINPLIPLDDMAVDGDVHSSVSITGSWHGHIVVACSAGAAKLVAAAFLMVEPAEVTDADLADVLGELANIIGGNVKSMLPDGCFISLPHVVTAPASVNHWPSASMVCELAGIWAGEQVSISMWQSRGAVAR
jgi:chemotaxis protein CheX